MRSVLLRSLAALLIFTITLLYTFQSHTMDLRNSVELEKIDIEAQEQKKSLLDQLKDAVINEDIKETKQLLYTTAELTSHRKRDRIIRKFNRWLHKQRLMPKSFIKNGTHIHNEIMCCSLLFLFLTFGSFFVAATSPLQNILIAGGVTLTILVCIMCDHIRLKCLLSKTKKIENNNLLLHYAQTAVQNIIQKLYARKKNTSK